MINFQGSKKQFKIIINKKGLKYMSCDHELIYIAGYGRSGSTLLERILQCQSSFCACGEMANFWNIYGSDSSFCSCGASLEVCQFWGEVAKQLFQRDFFKENFSSYNRIQKKREGH